MHAIFRYSDHARPDTENPGKWNWKIRHVKSLISNFGFEKSTILEF